MVKREVVIKNRLGIHARPAASIVKITGKYKSNIVFDKDGIKANAKSIMDLLILEAEGGSVITIIAEGEDEKKALEEVVELVNNGFGEE
jgi:phosphocarrier protein